MAQLARKGTSGEGFRMPARRDLSTVLRASVRKPLRKEPAGAGRAVCRLWGFDGVVACVGDAPAGVWRRIDDRSREFVVAAAVGRPRSGYSSTAGDPRAHFTSRPASALARHLGRG